MNHKKITIWFTIIIVALGVMKNVTEADSLISTAPDSSRFQDCAQWLKYHANSTIFHSSWDNFPELFYFNHDSEYLFGLTPDFIYLYNKTKYYAWLNVRRGQVENPANVIINTFNSRYAFVDNRYEKFEEQLELDKDAKLAWYSRECRIYRLYPETQNKDNNKD